MSSLKTSLANCLNEHSHDTAGLLRELDRIVQEEGDRGFSELLKLMAHLDFDADEARAMWGEILVHQEALSAQLSRPVSLQTAVCDYFSSVRKVLCAPKVIELNEYEKTALSSHSDGLTGLFNRRYFDEALTGEIHRAQRYGTEFSVLFLDMDNFKRINDTHGHQAGDAALKAVAETILSVKRSEDTAARYGGEELVVILPETGKMRALVIAERLRRKIETLTLTHDGKAFNLTVSGGIAAFPADAPPDANALMRCADAAMYSAKTAGKNRIALHSPDKRRYLRLDFTGHIEIRVLGNAAGGSVNGQTKNLSLGGVLVSSPQPVELGASVQLQIPFTSPANPLLLTGTVVRVEIIDGQYELGVSLLKLAGETRNEFTRYLIENLGLPPM